MNMARKRTFMIMTLCLLSQFAGCPLSNARDKKIELFALRYGESTFQNHYVFQKGDKTKIPLVWMFWAVRDGRKVFLIDCGIKDQALIHAWQIKNYSGPVSLLEKLDISKKDISGIIITHLHADHFDGALSFPNCKFYLQKSAFAAIEKQFNHLTGKSFSHSYKKNHYLFLKRLLAKNRLVLISGSKQITHNISVRLVPYHTHGLQSVIVGDGNNNYHFISDNAYMYQNIKELHPVGICLDFKGNLDYLKEMKALDPEKHVIIPGHDPEVFIRFPMEKGIKNIVRLN